MHINAGLQAQFFKKITFWQPSTVKCSLQNKETKKTHMEGSIFHAALHKLFISNLFNMHL